MSEKNTAGLKDSFYAPKAAPKLFNIGATLAVLGIILTVVAAMGDSLVNAVYGYLWGFGFIWAIALGSLFLIALQHITNARWSVVYRRVMEMNASPMWIVAIIFLPILLLVYKYHDFGLFLWADHAKTAHDHLLHGKGWYLSTEFFTARAAFFFLVWLGFGAYYIKTSVKQDTGINADELTTKKMQTRSPIFMILFGLSVTFAGIDWFMSQEPLWFSTMFGVYIFAGVMLSGLAATTLGAIALEKSGRFKAGLFTKDHWYSLGCFMFAFSIFWAYVGFSQYMLIWYANMPEETFYFAKRLDGNWLTISVAMAFIRFIIPFLVLLSRHAKMNTKILWGMSFFILFGQLVDLYWIIMPVLHKQATIGIGELGPVIAMTGIFLLAVASFVKKNSVLAVGDPVLEESKCFHL